jgi:type II secretion system protein G
MRRKDGMKSSKGYTLIELLIVVLILGALAIIVVPRIPEGAQKAKVNSCRTNVRLLNSQIEIYKLNTGSWPTTLTEVTEDNDYFPDGPPQCPFGGTYIYNSITHRIDMHDHSSE